MHFKFSGRCSAARRTAVLAAVEAHGGLNPRRVFPRLDSDTSLRRIYMAEAEDPAQGAGLVAWLQTEAGIEYAELAPTRLSFD
ncbi:MAG: hypothetical protein ACKOJF_34740, partial [Planctomycetaceae bacterium]